MMIRSSLRRWAVSIVAREQEFKLRKSAKYAFVNLQLARVGEHFSSAETLLKNAHPLAKDKGWLTKHSDILKNKKAVNTQGRFLFFKISENYCHVAVIVRLEYFVGFNLKTKRPSSLWTVSLFFTPFWPTYSIFLGRFSVQAGSHLQSSLTPIIL
jgi:hypothetical protein